MKRRFSPVLAAILVILLSIPVFGEGEAPYARLNGVYLVGDTLYYTTNDETEETSGLAVYKMSIADPSAKSVVTRGDFFLTTVSDDKLLLHNWEGSELMIVSGAGEELLRKQTDSRNAYSRPIAANGWFYCGNYAISDDGTREKTFFEIDADEHWMIVPVAVDGDNYYYLDQREYGEKAIEYLNCAALYRVDLASGDIAQVSPPGTRYVGMDESGIYYVRQNFLCYDENGNGAYAIVDQGLFRANADGGGEVRLADAGEITDAEYIEYKLIEDGVLYGIHMDFSAEETLKELVRVGADGAQMPPVELEEDALHGVWNGKLIVSQNIFSEFDEEYGQEDLLIAIDLETMERTELNPGGKYMLYFSEDDPYVAIVGDTAYFLAYDVAAPSMNLYAAKLDGGGVTLLVEQVM